MRPTTCCVCCRLQRRLTLRYARSIYLLVVVISWMWCFSNGWNPKVQHLVLWVEYMAPLCDLSNHGVQPWLNGIVITIKDCTCHLQCLHYATCIRQWNLAVASVILPGDHASIMRCALRHHLGVYDWLIITYTEYSLNHYALLVCSWIYRFVLG